MSTTASILFAIGVVLWRAYEDRLAASDRAGIKARQDQQERTIKGIQDAIAQCPMAWTTNENGESIWASRKFPRRCCAA